jgi:hypothetical protein
MLCFRTSSYSLSAAGLRNLLYVRGCFRSIAEDLRRFARAARLRYNQSTPRLSYTEIPQVLPPHKCKDTLTRDRMHQPIHNIQEQGAYGQHGLVLRESVHSS